MKKLITGIILSVVCWSSNAALITLNSTDNGWYKSDGIHTTTNTNTFTGLFSGSEYRSFYNFDVSSLVGGTITAASIRFFSTGRIETDTGFEQIGIFNVTTLPGTGNSVAIFNDLGTGNTYGSRGLTLASGSTMPDFTVTLTANSFADILNDNTFSLGAALLTISSERVQGFWAGSLASPAAQLIVDWTAAQQPNDNNSDEIPEPATLGLFVLALLSMSRFRRG
ncbi:PEP-CTERM sorting domain-containing protein [Alteromonas sp. S167]|uniref:PEP-CTERM sorting domain-containing protein n=1 Tax=Alteromonas sp. S167 TaxID=3117402 RepID=UPI002FE2F6B2